MEEQEKSGKTYLFLLVLTLLFLAAMGVVIRQDRGGADDYTVRTELRAAAEQPADRLIDINTANAEELQQLMGIGPVLAQAIVDYRSEHGPFASVEELLFVSGIGEGKLEGIRNDVTVGETENSDEDTGR